MMNIGFYEEFPTKKNLKKLKLITFNSRVFIASKSLKEFQKLKNQIKKINKKIKIGWWPIIENSYYISPFSNFSDLIKIFNELNKLDNEILIDLELPLKNKKIIIKNLFNFFKNKRLIKIIAFLIDLMYLLK